MQPRMSTGHLSASLGAAAGVTRISLMKKATSQRDMKSKRSSMKLHPKAATTSFLFSNLTDERMKSRITLSWGLPLAYRKRTRTLTYILAFTPQAVPRSQPHLAGQSVKQGKHEKFLNKQACAIELFHSLTSMEFATCGDCSHCLSWHTSASSISLPFAARRCCH